MLPTYAEALLIVIPLSALAYFGRFLDKSGAAAAAVIGFIIYWLGGVEYFIILIVFFIVSSLFTKYHYVDKYGEAPRSLRSWNNVFGNGLVPALSVILGRIFLMDEGISFAVYLGSISAAFSDTMATEIGLLSPRLPRLITNLKIVERGRSGGVSLHGYLGISLAILTLWISTVFLKGLFKNPSYDLFMLLVIIASSGFAGGTLDSIAGALLQAQYKCPSCNKIVENSMHCGVKAVRISGLRAVNNDVINIIATLSGAVAGYYIAALY